MSALSSRPARHGARAGKLAWLRRHQCRPVISALIAVVAIAAAATGCGDARPEPAASTAKALPAVRLAPPRLTCSARLTSDRPRDHTIVRVTVHTVAHAHVRIVSVLALTAGETAAGRASVHGIWVRHLHIGNAVPGIQVLITVHISRSAHKGTCEAWLRPRSAAVAVAPRPTPTTTATSPPPPPPPPPAPAGCYPKTDGGNCYEPGEYCRDSDHGTTGVAGDGEKIRCEDNDGWRWEPY